MKRFIIAACGFGLCGCAHLATVKTTQPRVPAIAATHNEQLRAATGYLARAEKEQPLASLGDDLSAAKLSLNILKNRPGDQPAQTIYNFSVARVVENVQRANLQPWRQSIHVASDHEDYALTTPKPVDPDH